MKNNKLNIWVKFLAFMLLMLNGNYPLVYFGYLIGEGPSRVLWSIVFIAVILLKLKLKIKVKPIFILFYMVFVILTLLQNEYLNSFFLQEFLNLSFLFLITYLIVYAIGFKGLLYIPKIMVKLIKFSLVFYIPSAVLFILGVNWSSLIRSVSFQSNASRIGTSTEPLHIIIHNFSGLFREFGYGANSLIPRNSGMFWEPGAFAGAIIMVFIFVVIYKKYFTKLELRKINMWLFIGLISTFSTTGLLIVPMLILIYYLRDKKASVKVIFKLIFLCSIVSIISIAAFMNISTLNEKVTSEIERVDSNDRGSETSRLGSLFLVFQMVEENPYIGVGFAASSEVFSDKLSVLGYEFTEIGIGNGMILMLAWCGIPYCLFLIFLMVYNFKMSGMSMGLSMGLIFVILLLLQGESWMRLPLIYSFCFLSIHKPKQQI